ncbi:MAG: tetratricopeptide repeat protein, partial [Candidatus Zixiibacteriota bacterium]
MSATALTLTLGILSLNLPADRRNAEEMTARLPDLYDLWDYNDPAGTRAKFEEILPGAETAADISYHLQLLTQIARTYGLEAKFEDAHRLLDRVENSLTDDLALARVRYLLERGRTYRSAGEASKASPLFLESYELSLRIDADFYAVDAAHMVAIAASEFAEKEKWNLTGIRNAESSEDPRTRKWLGSLYNNMGWDYHERKEYDKSLTMFERALAFRRKRGDAGEISVARWCIAKTYRFLNRIDEALEIQLELLNEYEDSGSPDGYVFEELGELYLIKNDSAKYTGYFAKAH